MTSRSSTRVGGPVAEYAEAIYAGVLGKIIGVYLGRPVEGWPYEEIQARFGEVAVLRQRGRRHPADRRR